MVYDALHVRVQKRGIGLPMFCPDGIIKLLSPTLFGWRCGSGVAVSVQNLSVTSLLHTQQPTKANIVSLEPPENLKSLKLCIFHYTKGACPLTHWPLVWSSVEPTTSPSVPWYLQCPSYTIVGNYSLAHQAYPSIMIILEGALLASKPKKWCEFGSLICTVYINKLYIPMDELNT